MYSGCRDNYFFPSEKEPIIVALFQGVPEVFGHFDNKDKEKPGLTTAWTQWTVPELTQTRSPGLWMNRYTGMSSSYKSSRTGHHEPFKKLMLAL